MDTLIGQAYGAGAYRLMGLHAQRAMLILTLAAVPVAVIWSLTEPILRSGLAIDPVVAASAGRWSAPVQHRLTDSGGVAEAV